MGLFWTPPKRITDRELKGTEFHPGALDGLKQTGFFPDSSKLRPHEFEALESIVKGYDDRGRHEGRSVSGITADEVDAMVQDMRANKTFSDKKIDHIEKHLRKNL